MNDFDSKHFKMDFEIKNKETLFNGIFMTGVNQVSFLSTLTSTIAILEN